MNYILGLDIGIASVGWGIVNAHTNEVVETGVRLFDSADASKNEDRRGYRGGRRNKRRQQHRLERVRQLLNKNGIILPHDLDLNPIECRVKGLNEKLSKEELHAALYNIVKHRGISYLEDIEIDEKDKSSASGLSRNALELETKYPCQIQLQRLNDFGYFRGTNVLDNNETIINTFTTKAYKEEAIKIIETQMNYHNDITKDFLDKYIELLTKKREYYIGPGNEYSRTNYGVYKTSGETKLNLFDELRGKCTIFNTKNGYEDELRASSASYTSQYYNLLNDLCNIKVDNQKLTKEQKEKIIEYIKEEKNKTKITAVLKKLFKIEPELVSGYRVDKNGKEENHSFEVYRKMRNFGIDVGSYKSDVLDMVADILTLNTEKDSIMKFFKHQDYSLVNGISDSEIELFIEFRRKNTNLFSKWHSLSYKVLRLLIPEMLESGDEQHTCIKRMNLVKQKDIQSNKIEVEDILDEIYNPVVKRSINQTVKIVNALLKKYDFARIVIEMPRDRNDKEQKDRIKKSQKRYEESTKEALAYAGLDLESYENYSHNHKNLMQKLKLYKEQDGICLYSGKKIELDVLIKNQMAYEIDHIIPISISFDDSQANKVLVSSDQNRLKSNMTPYNYLKNNNSEWNYNKYKAFVLDLYKSKKINNKKKSLLTFEDDITKQEVVQGFINRNLNDTTYAAKTVLNHLQSYFSSNKRSTKIKVVKGSFTNQFRKSYIKLEKDRDLDYRHHAIDALICCYMDISMNKYSDEYINIETGEVISKEQLNSLANEGKEAYVTNDNFFIRNKLIDANSIIKFSHKVDRKVNRSISDQTIYSTREFDNKKYVVNKIKDIYDDAEYEKFSKKIIAKSKDENLNLENKFLMYRHDRKTWDILMAIIKQYPDKKNPFKAFKEEEGAIRKYSKKGNGPFLKELKYLDHNLGSHIPITNKYKESTKEIVLEGLKPFRSDIYFDKNNNCFNVIPIRYSDFKFERGLYILDIDKYNNILINEGLIKDSQTYLDCAINNHEFRFSLYKNDVIEIGDENKVNVYRFLAKNHASKNTFEVKLCDAVSEKRIFISTKKSDTVFNKYNVDILGNMYKVTKEKLILEFNVDNKMIK